MGPAWLAFSYAVAKSQHAGVDEKLAWASFMHAHPFCWKNVKRLRLKATVSE